MNPENIWLDVKTVAEIKEVTPRAVRISLSKKGNEFASGTSASPDKYTFRH